MPVCRLFSDSSLANGEDIQLSAEQGHYLRQVMRAQKGDRLLLFDGSGGEYEAEITLLGKRGCDCRILEFFDVDRELRTAVHIVQAACRADKVEAVLQKCTELGAFSFQIVCSERATLRLTAGKLDARLARWRRIVAEACEQSGRTRLPGITWHDSLAGMEAKGEFCFALHPQADTAWPDVRGRLSGARSINLAVGPEGGWSPADLSRLAGAGYTPLRFGERTLRTETAAPALLAAVQAVLD